jgi:hypothetical protein
MDEARRYTPAGEDMGNEEAPGHPPMLSLRDLMERYTELAGKPGVPVRLSAFGFSEEETQNVFSAFDEDYHISRFLHFSNTDGEKYMISGEAATHVAIEPAIRSLF